MMGIARGVALIISGGVGIQLLELPESFKFLGGGRVLGVVPAPVLITAMLAVLGYLVLQLHPPGTLHLRYRQQSWKRCASRA